MRFCAVNKYWTNLSSSLPTIMDSHLPNCTGPDCSVSAGHRQKISTFLLKKRVQGRFQRQISSKIWLLFAVFPLTRNTDYTYCCFIPWTGIGAFHAVVKQTNINWPASLQNDMWTDALFPFNPSSASIFLHNTRFQGKGCGRRFSDGASHRRSLQRRDRHRRRLSQPVGHWAAELQCVLPAIKNEYKPSPE